MIRIDVLDWYAHNKSRDYLRFNVSLQLVESHYETVSASRTKVNPPQTI